MNTKAILLGLAIALAFFISACSGDVNGVSEPILAPKFAYHMNEIDTAIAKVK